MDPKAWSGREVVNVGPKGVRRWVARLKGAEVETTARTGAGKPRVAVKAYASGMAAGAELIKTLRKKMLEDFVYLRPEAGVGELFFAMALPGGGPADNFDVSADGQVLFVGAGRGDPRAQLVRASLSTGEVQRFEVVANPGDRQLFIHGALVSADGASGVYGLGAGVRAVDLASGAWRAVASVLHRGQEHVNPFCVEPQRDAAQQRVLLVDGENLEVRAWGSGARIFQVPIGTATAECRRIALSPSGELAAAYVVSRDIVYGHDDARRDATNEVQVWRVADGRRVATVAIEGRAQPREIAVTPDDAAILHDGGGSLVCVALAGAKRRVVLGEGSAGVWAWTPGGELAVFDGGELSLLAKGDFAAGASWRLERQRGQRIRCAPGMAVIGGEGLFCAYRMAW